MWEYHAYVCDEPLSISMLDKFGADRWELVNIMRYDFGPARDSKSYYVYHFKREAIAPRYTGAVGEKSK